MVERHDSQLAELNSHALALEQARREALIDGIRHRPRPGRGAGRVGSRNAAGGLDPSGLSPLEEDVMSVLGQGEDVASYTTIDEASFAELADELHDHED